VLLTALAATFAAAVAAAAPAAPAAPAATSAAAGCLCICCCRLSSTTHCLTDQQVHQLAATTHGFVGADLAALVNEAALSALRRHIQQQQQQQLETQQISVQQGQQQQQADTPATATEQGQQQQQQQQGLQLCVTWDDIAAARLLVKPSALREVAVEVPQVTVQAKSKDLKRRFQKDALAAVATDIVRMFISCSSDDSFVFPEVLSEVFWSKTRGASGLHKVPLFGLFL